MKGFIHLSKIFEILCVIPCPVNLDGYLCVLEEKNNELDAILHFKRNLKQCKQAQKLAQVDALEIICHIVLQSITEYYRILQSMTDYF